MTDASSSSSSIVALMRLMMTAAGADSRRRVKRDPGNRHSTGPAPDKRHSSDDDDHSNATSISRFLQELEDVYLARSAFSSSEDTSTSIGSSDSEDDNNIDDDDDVESVDSSAPLVRQVRQWKRFSSWDAKAVTKRVRSDFEEIEAKKPWKFVYRCVEMPFESNRKTDPYGFLFERWDEFWVKHARAVWEREFWAPLEPGSPGYRSRKNRQAQAAKAFRALGAELYDVFGMTLRKQIEKRPHPGWWYRPHRPINLRRLLVTQSEIYPLHLSRFQERWPSGIRHVRQRIDPLWCLLTSERDDHDDRDEGDVDSYRMLGNTSERASVTE
ncbi:hypothetical protein PINS_up003475 [Pythium insidiosum]|nr:hypothetical protein PINS_up003475 [Pythium insidiosum]